MNARSGAVRTLWSCQPRFEATAMNLSREISEGLKISGSAIFANKLRSSLTTLGIVIGIVTVSLMSMAIEGMRQKFIRSISALGADVFYIEKFPWENTGPWWKMRNRRDFAMSDAKVIQRESTHALAVSVENSITLPVRYRDRNSSAAWIVGNNEQSALVRQLIVKEGRFFSEAEVAGARPVCVLGAEIAGKLFPQGRALGERIQIAGKSFEVIGVNEKFGAFLFANMDNQVIIPITRLTSDFVRDPYIFFMVKVRPESKMDEAKEELRGIVRKFRRVPPGADDDFAINQQEMMIKQFDKVQRIVGSIGLFITGLALFVGGIGIMNIMFVSVAERTKEIGIRKAIGAKRRTILIQFLIEAATICLFGGFVGLGAAWGASLGLKKFLPAEMSMQVAGLAIAMSLFTGIVAGFLPAYRAARMSPVDALRAE
jgi:putative ABC transport system permease protein